MNKITHCQRACWGSFAGIALAAAATLVALGVLHRLRPLIAYTSAGGAAVLSLAFLAMACRKNRHLEPKAAEPAPPPTPHQPKPATQPVKPKGAKPASPLPPPRGRDHPASLPPLRPQGSTKQPIDNDEFENACSDDDSVAAKKSDKKNSDDFQDTDVAETSQTSPEPVTPSLPMPLTLKEIEKITSDFERALTVARTNRDEGIRGALQALMNVQNMDLCKGIPGHPTGDSYLIILAKYGGPIELLNKFDGDFTYVDSSGNTALHWACANAHYEMAQALLNTRKNNLRIQDEKFGGNTPLTLVLAQGYEGKDGDGTPLSVSYEQLVEKMVELDPEIVNIPHHLTGLYPVELALCRRHMDMVQRLTPGVLVPNLKRFSTMTYYESLLELRRCFDNTGVLQGLWDSLPAWLNSPYQHYQHAQEEVDHYIRVQKSLHQPTGT